MLTSLAGFTGRATVFVQADKVIKTGLRLPPRANIVHTFQSTVILGSLPQETKQKQQQQNEARLNLNHTTLF